MSMRATFTTEFIYDGTEGYQDRRSMLSSILNVGVDESNGTVIGRISGVTSGLDLGESDIKRDIEEMCYQLVRIPTVPFRIVWLFEGGDILIKEINPNSPEKEPSLSD